MLLLNLLDENAERGRVVDEDLIKTAIEKFFEPLLQALLSPGSPERAFAAPPQGDAA